MSQIDYLQKKQIKVLSRLSLYLIFIFISSPINSCDIKQFTDAHLSLLTKLNLPENSLLSIEKNNIAVITNKPIKAQLNVIGPEELKIYQLISDRLVLKRITNVDINFDQLKFLEKQKMSNVTLTLVSQNGIFIFVDRINLNDMPSCYTELFYPINDTNSHYNMLSTAASTKNKHQKLTKNLIITNLLNSNHNFKYTDDTIVLSLEPHKNYDYIYKAVDKLQETNPFSKYLIIKPQKAGLQLSEIQMPISSYERAHKFKDENELFYSSVFRVSKNPNLIKSKQDYKIDLGLREEKAYLEIMSRFSQSKSLDTNFGLLYTNKELSISKLNLGYKKLDKSRLLYIGNFGKFSKFDTGFLLNTHKLNIDNDSLMSFTAYLGLEQNCELCIRNGISVGYEQYFAKLKSYTRTNLLFHNLKQQSETMVEISIRKPLTNRKQLIISTQYELDNKSPKLSVKLDFPLLSTCCIGSISYKPIKKEFISKWANEANYDLLANTPNFLKRNWKNYFNF